MEKNILVIFAEHLKPIDIQKLVAGLVHHGILETVCERNILIRVSRPDRLERLKKWLNHLSGLGRLSWSEISQKEAGALPRRPAPEEPVPESSPPVLKGRVPAIEEPRPKKKINSAQRRELKATEMRLFVREYGRKAQKGQDPNDRGYSRDIERKAKRMKPEELDKLLRGDDE